MFRFILPLSILCLASFASAEVYQVQLGQNATIRSGDVVVVSAYGNSTAITCGGGAPVGRQSFSIERVARFPDIYQSGSDLGRSGQCVVYSALQEIKQAINDAQYSAREACFNAGYRNCAPPSQTDQQYAFYVRGTQGNYTCHVIARIIGTNP